VKALVQIARDDAAVKLIFDHLRNLGLCAVVFGAAVWKFFNLESGWARYLDFAIIAFLVALGIALFWINQIHGFSKLRELKQPKWVVALIGQVYVFLAVTIVYFLAAGRLQA
jgi:uncharacterized protein YjeT (DUF2065 family)